MEKCLLWLKIRWLIRTDSSEVHVFINSTPLITIIDIGATHCFIAADCVERLGLILSSMNGEMVIEIPAKDW